MDRLSAPGPLSSAGARARSRAALLCALTFALACGDSTDRDTEAATLPTGIDSSPSSSGTDSAGSEGPSTTAGGATEGTGGVTTSASATEPATSSGTAPLTTTDDSDASTSSTTQTTQTTDTTGNTGNTGLPDGCQQVDFVFAIDNSVSMEGEQAALTAAFPQFIDTIKNELPTDDYHIMVVDTDAETRCTPAACAGVPHETCEGKQGYACTADFTDCDTVRGAGVIQPAGAFASNQLCELYAGNRYIVQDEPNLVDAFTCVATVGTAGDPSERPMDALVESISPALVGPGGCNLDFLRDDAILVLTFISDDPNVEDLNSAQQAYDQIIAAKGGDTDSTVVLGLIPGETVGCPNGNKPNAGKHWEEFIGLFGERGIMGPVCDEDFNQFFQNAVDIIAETCTLNPPE